MYRPGDDLVRLAFLSLVKFLASTVHHDAGDYGWFVSLCFEDVVEVVARTTWEGLASAALVKQFGQGRSYGDVQVAF